MDKRLATNLFVGVFVLIGLTLFVLLLFNMGGGQGVFSSQYTLFGKFGHVKGLHYGSEITLNGLRVGTVKNIHISPDAKELVVELALNKKFHDRIRKDSVAKVVTQGMLGDKYIDVSLGTPSEPTLNHGEFIETAEEKDLFTKGGGLIDELSKKFDNRGDIDSILKNLNRASYDIATITSEAKKGKGLVAELTNGKSGEKLASATAHLESILRKIDEGEGTLGALMNDPTIYEDVKTILGGAKRSSVLKYFVNTFKDSAEKEKKK
jgi:phospholipid/cholesterol/gamma-HCH transport system substrate-binding protein